MKDFFKKFFKISEKVIKDEVEEIKELKPTEEDYTQGERLANAAILAMSSFGLPYSILGREIMKKVFAYGIRDIRDGIQDNSKLIMRRVINEINAERRERDKKKETSN